MERAEPGQLSASQAIAPRMTTTATTATITPVFGPDDAAGCCGAAARPRRRRRGTSECCPPGRSCPRGPGGHGGCVPWARTLANSGVRPNPGSVKAPHRRRRTRESLRAVARCTRPRSAPGARWAFDPVPTQPFAFLYLCKAIFVCLQQPTGFMVALSNNMQWNSLGVPWPHGVSTKNWPGNSAPSEPSNADSPAPCLLNALADPPPCWPSSISTARCGSAGWPSYWPSTCL